jgi:alpha/beta superfamily hydrolase
MISIRFCNSSGCELVSYPVPTQDGVDQDELISKTLREAVSNGIFCVGDTIRIVEEA